jgi:NAD(P)-dependent dehydrogenase (short-subunit alcohol dehydrogenase family)
MRINAYGPFFIVRAAWRHFTAQQYGRIVMVSSSAALFGLPDRVDYAASKAAMVGMTRSFAADGDEHNIRANALFPTAITRISSLPVRGRVAALLGLSAEDDGLPALMERSTALVSPMVAWLAHDGCHSNGEVFEAGTGHAGRVLIASTQGYDNIATTPEDIRAHLNEIQSLDGLVERKSFSTRAAGVTASAPDPQL